MGGGLPKQVEGSLRFPEAFSPSNFNWLRGDGLRITPEPKQGTVRPRQGELVFFSEVVDRDNGSLFQDHANYYNSENGNTK
jgi:hypothetical protein